VSGVIVGDDGLGRCPWVAGDEALREYHDSEWGVPLHGEQALFERICLEAFQSGLSWLIVLRKRPTLRRAFDDFDPAVVATYSDDDLTERLADPGIIRNRAKVEAVRHNARATVALRDHGGLDSLVWSHRHERSPAVGRLDELASTSAESIALARELKRAGFRFVGPTTVHALMQAVGLVDAHLAGCHRRGVTS
jgi:DNA-3-methyladenine glycosylase I